MLSSPDDPFIVETRAWVERVVIGLKLCPFAPAPALKGLICYTTSEAETPEALLEDLAAELQRLVAAPPEQIETTLLIHPQVLQGSAEGFDGGLLVGDALQQPLVIRRGDVCRPGARRSRRHQGGGQGP